MVTANPTDIIEVLRQILTQGLTDSPQTEQLKKIYDQIETDFGKAGDQVKQLGQVPKELKDLVDPPDWWSLLVFLVVKFKELVGDDHVTVGYRQPAGWSRMLTLNYSTDPSSPDTSMVGSLGVAITDPGVKHGISLQIINPVPKLQFTVGSLKVSISPTGSADWRYVLGEAMAPPAMAPPSQSASCTVDLQWQPWDGSYPEQVPGHPSAFEFDLGPLHLNLVLSTMAPLYTVALGLGTDSVPGAKPTIRPEVAFGPALGNFIKVGVPEESYSPQLTVVAGGSPRFSLGNIGTG